MSTDQARQPLRFESLRGLAARWGVTVGALSQRRAAGRFPAPDAFIGDSPGWDADRADAWWQQVDHVRGGAAPRRRQS